MVYLWVLVLTFTAHAQVFTEDLSKINYSLSENIIDSYVKNPDKDGVPGAFLGSIIPKDNFDLTQICPEDENKQKPENVRYEVILVAEGGTGSADRKERPRFSYGLSDAQLKQYFQSSTHKLDEQEVMSAAQSVWNSYVGGRPYDPQSLIGKELLAESMVHSVRNSSMSENELATGMANIIRNTYSTEEDRLNFLSALSARLYRNYNNARNPGYNNSVNNPDNHPLPSGDMTLQDLMNGAANFNSFEGGVCNDISEAVAMIGEKVFPEKDVLVINSGTHFGVMVADGENINVIDGAVQHNMQGQMLLRPEFASTNLRISKVENGHLKEIAVVDTQMGELMEKAFDTGKPLLKTAPDVRSVVGHFIRAHDLGNGKTSESTFGLAKGRLEDSDVVVIVAKYKIITGKSESYLGVGLSRQELKGGLARDKASFQAHFRAGADYDFIHYVNPRTEVKFNSGLKAEGMYGLDQSKPQNGNVPAMDLSVQLDWINRLEGRHEAPNGILMSGAVETQHTAGSSNWGNMTGATSKLSKDGIIRALGDMNFHLNQINAEGRLEKDLSSSVRGFTQINYKGSNIGQNLGALAGVSIRANNGAEILVFTGYSTKYKGYMTKHNLIDGDEDAQIGMEYETKKKGVKVYGTIKDITPGGDPSYEAGIRMQLGK